MGILIFNGAGMTVYMSVFHVILATDHSILLCILRQ